MSNPQATRAVSAHGRLHAVLHELLLDREVEVAADVYRLRAADERQSDGRFDAVVKDVRCRRDAAPLEPAGARRCHRRQVVEEPVDRDVEGPNRVVR